MKPLGEWTEKELEDGVLFIRWEVYQKQKILAEIRRRERLKIAAEVRAVPRCGCRERGFCECYGYETFDRLAVRIEGMK